MLLGTLAGVAGQSVAHGGGPAPGSHAAVQVQAGVQVDRRIHLGKNTSRLSPCGQIHVLPRPPLQTHEPNALPVPPTLDRHMNRIHFLSRPCYTDTLRQIHFLSHPRYTDT